MHQLVPILAAFLLSAVSATNNGGKHHYHTVTTTIPWVGSTVTTTTLAKCSKTVTVVVETPLKGAACMSPPAYPTSSYHTSSRYPTNTKMTTKPSVTTTSSPTSIKSTTSSSTTIKPTASSSTSVTSIATSSTSITSTTITSTSIEPTTSSSTTSSSVIPIPSPDGSCPFIKPFCQPLGYNVDYYHNDFGQYSRADSGVLSNYYIVQGLSPLASSFANITVFPRTFNTPPNSVYPNASLPRSLGPYYPGWTRVLYGMTIDTNNFTLVYQGFYRAPVTGTYQLCTSADDENDIYFGDENAFSCRTGLPPTSANPKAQAFDTTPQKCATVTMTAGRFYPFRSVMGDFHGPAAIDFSILPPGTTIENRSNNFSGLAYPRECGVFLPL